MLSNTPYSERDISPFSTPVNELDDLRFQMESQPQQDPLGVGDPPTQHTTQTTRPAFAHSQDAFDRSDLLQVRSTAREIAFIPRDFEQAIIDDDHSFRETPFSRRLSVDPPHRRRRRSRNQQDVTPRSRDSSPSDRSSSPPNSVDAFADPRRRERANTLESHAPTDLDPILHATVSGGSLARRPTFSNASAMRHDQGGSQLDVNENPTISHFQEPGRIPVIDYEELEEFVALSNQNRRPGEREKPSPTLHSLRSAVSRQQGIALPNIVVIPSVDQCCTDESASEPADHFKVDHADEKDLLSTLPNANRATRFTFFSSECETTVHAAELGDLILPGDTFRDLFQLGPDGGVWWLDVVNPTEAEVGALSRAFSIHPLTTEDIMTQEAREKVELFKQYYFVCFRTFFQVDKISDRFLDPVHIYMVVYRDGVLSFSFTENPHASNVRRRIGKLHDYVALSSDWICYAMM
jgi:magnesium transporter